MDVAGLRIDPLAIAALAFLVAILATTFGLFGWLMLQGGKGKRTSAGTE